VSILRDLRAVIGAHMARDPTRVSLFTLLWTRIGRISCRFETLFAQWQAGALPQRRASRAGTHAAASARRPRTTRTPSPRLPRGRTWVVALVGYRAAGHAGQLQHLLADPAMPAFLAAVPQAGRMLRPLCHILGITAAPDLSAELNLPPPPRFRPSPPPPPPDRGIIDPPEVTPLFLGLPRGRAGRAWYQ